MPVKAILKITFSTDLLDVVSRTCEKASDVFKEPGKIKQLDLF